MHRADAVGVVRRHLAVQSRGRLRFDFQTHDDVDKATSLGATVIAGKTDGPAGTVVTTADPGGALVALWTPFAGKT
jgi:predicted enzyme related to lactoylglutathione lyase